MEGRAHFPAPCARIQRTFPIRERISLEASIPVAGFARVAVSLRMMESLAAPQADDRKTIMIDATYLKAPRTASRRRAKKEARPV